MKNNCIILIIFFFGACSNPADNAKQSGKDSNSSTEKEKNELLVRPGGNSCDNNLLFRKGVEIQTTTNNVQGNVTMKSVSRITKVYEEGGMTVSECEMKTAAENGANEKVTTARYKCDGKHFYMDLASFLSDTKQNTRVETTGLQFPFNVTVGETLPDASSSIVTNRGGKEMKITSHIKERKVEAKESVTTAAGAFECYRISCIIETDIPGMDDKSKEVMKEVKKKMGTNKMIFWYAPGITIIKMEFFMGDKLVTRSEVTGIKK